MAERTRSGLGAPRWALFVESRSSCSTRGVVGTDRFGETLGMHVVSWLAFVSTSALTRTVVHFFPFSSGVSAPYGSECRFTVFGGGLATRSVLLDGARLGQPDGVRVEDVFPEVSSVGDARLVGLQVDLECAQQRVDLSASGCVVEITRTDGGAVRFRPSLLHTAGGAAPATAPLVACRDRFQTTSLVVINRTTEPFVPTMRCRPIAARPWDGAVDLLEFSAAAVAPDSVEEIHLEDSVWGDATRQECSWGESTTRAVDVPVYPPGVALYACYREPEHRRPVSVSAL